MSTSRTARATVNVIPMIIALIAARRIAPGLRTVDFVTVFAAGVVFGVTLFGLIQALRGRGRSQG